MKKKLFILHGWAYNTDKWAPFLSLLEENNIQPIMLKIPGLTAPLKNVWTLDDYVLWLKEIVDLEKDKVALLGHSNGGRISIAFAARYPEKVSQLILMDSAGIYHNELPIKVKRLVFGTLARVGKKFSHDPRLKKLLYRFAREHDYEKSDPIVKETMVNLIRADLQELFPQLTLPVCIIWGKDDKITPLSDGKVIHSQVKNSSLHIVPDARHSPQFTHPEKVAQIVVKELL